MKQLTEAQAWRKIARDIEKNGLRFGLCERVRSYSLGIPWEIRERMQARIGAHMGVCGLNSWQFAWRVGQADVRIIAANLLALEAADEARAAR